MDTLKLKEDFLESRERLFDACQALLPYSLQGFDHDLYRLPERKRPFHWFSLSLNIESFTTGLINTINQQLQVVHQFEGWKSVLDSYPEDRRQTYLFGSVSPLAQWLIGTPWNYRNRVVYCSIVLLNDAEELLGNHLGAINEKNFNYAHLEKHPMISSLKLGIRPLLDGIALLNQDRIADLRNELNHRFPQNIEFGYSTFVVRHPSGRSVGMSGRSPILIDELANLIHREHHLMKDAFVAYWKFVKELVEKLEDRENV